MTRWLALACLALALLGCGRKGELELPNREAPDLEERPAPEVG